ncbi:MAG: VOC family protein [Candidatus Zophobacter franzmannii]|nr:VOC family protein [Candidatus Zophobacter franzmannii]
MQLGAFSVSLNVKDIKVSREFYLKLGFEEMGGNIEQNWLIMKNGSTVIGLFQGMFDKNLMTFNPGWDQAAQPLESFTDIREIQKALKIDGVELMQEADEKTKGHASVMLVDPDGNPILLDQHV